jgi:hypothetical protein
MREIIDVHTVAHTMLQWSAMRWADIAASLRRDFTVKSERYGLLIGVLRDVTSTAEQELQVVLEKGGRYLALIAEVGDAAMLMRRGMVGTAGGAGEMLVAGRLVALRHTFEVSHMNPAEMVKTARHLAVKARRLREEAMEDSRAQHRRVTAT